MEKAGYTLTAHFILPENCWTEHFYAPQFPAQEAFLKNTREMPQPQTSLPGNGMSRVCMTSIKNIMVMYST